VTRTLASTTNTTGATAFMPVPFAGARSGLLQRKCACGQHTRSAACESCAKRHRSSFGSGPQRSEHLRRDNHNSQAPRESWSQQGFAGMRVSAGAGGRETASTHQSVTDELSKRKYGADGILMTLEGSGTCMNGGAESKCNPSSGAYEIIRNSNTCCTNDCSRLHEQVHASDVSRWGCCKALSVAYNRPGADKNAVVQKYNAWMTQAGPVTECHAYKGDVDCAKTLAKAKDCDGAGRHTDCCKDIQDYQTRYAEFARVICASAGNDAPACPTF
jgi:hypothetical protein